MTRVPDRPGLPGLPRPDDLRRHHRDPEGDHRPDARPLAGFSTRVSVLAADLGHHGRGPSGRQSTTIAGATDQPRSDPMTTDVLADARRDRGRDRGPDPRRRPRRHRRDRAPRSPTPTSTTSPTGETWRTQTWTETGERALDVAAGLMKRGVQPATRSRSWPPTASSTSSPTSAPCTPPPPRCRSTTRSRRSRSPTWRATPSPTVAFLENADHLARWQRALDESGSLRGVVVIDARQPDGDDRFVTWDDLVAAGAAHRAEHGDEVTPGQTSSPRDAGDDPLHLGHDREPEGRGADPPQRALRGAQHPRGGRPPRPAARGQLPAARPHRRAGARPLRPADPGQPHPRHRRPRRAAGRARRGAPDGVLRRAAGLGEDQDRHLRQARRRPEPRQREAGPGRHGRRTGLGAGPGGRRHDDPGDRAGLPGGRRGDPRVPQAAPRPRPGRPGPGPPRRRCRSRSRGSWPASASRSSTSTA